MARALAYVFVLAIVTVLWQFLHWAGYEFCAGAFSAIVLYQLCHKYIHGRWIEF